MDAEVHRLEVIFRPGTQFIVPPYQRWYEWEVSNWQALWGDLIQAADQQRGTFMGPAFIYELRRKFGSTISPFSIVDGQQRYTTLVIVLAVIAEEFERQGALDEAAQTRSYVFNDRAKGLNKYRVLPKADSVDGSGRDRDTLFNLIDPQPDLPRSAGQDHVDATCLIYKAYQYFKIQTTALTQEEGSAASIPKLRALRAAITTLNFSVHTLEHHKDDQLEIFKRLHERGRDISNADLFRKGPLVRALRTC